MSLGSSSEASGSSRMERRCINSRISTSQPGGGSGDWSAMVHSTLGLSTADGTWYESTTTGRPGAMEFYGMTQSTSSFGRGAICRVILAANVDGGVRGSSGPVQEADV